MNRILINCFAILPFLACGRNHKDTHAKPALLYIYNSNFPSPAYYVEFTDLKTFIIPKSSIIAFDTSYFLDISEQGKLDSFLNIMKGESKDETYIDGAAPEEMHVLNIEINANEGTRKINIAGHRAPPVYYAFADWVGSLRSKYLYHNK